MLKSLFGHTSKTSKNFCKKFLTKNQISDIIPLSDKNNKHKTKKRIKNMKNTITLQQVKAWDKLVDIENTGEKVQALECYLFDNKGEICCEYEDEAVEVAFSAYDYDHKHDFDSIKSALRKVGVELDEDTLITERGDFDGGLHTSSDLTKYVHCSMFIIWLKLVK